MAGFRTVAGSGYGNVYTDSLIEGRLAWDMLSPIKFAFGGVTEIEFEEAIAARSSNASIYLTRSDLRYEWKPQEIAAQAYVLKLFESVTLLKFAPANNLTEANIVWWKPEFDDVHQDVAGAHETPGVQGRFFNQLWGFFNSTGPEWQEMQFGGVGLQTMIHELGHGLGLAHPHGGGQPDDRTQFPGVGDIDEDGNAINSTGEHGLNQGVYTVMSYFHGLDNNPANEAYGNQGGLGAFDIAALQALYGVNMSTATGDNVYALPTQNARGTGWSCIWDAGGNDTISGQASTSAVRIDLRAATLISHDPHAGGYISQQGNIAGGFTIANKVVIENATGGSGHDTLIGNDAANVLNGNDGHDMLRGEGGADRMYGGAGDDTYIVENVNDRAFETSAAGGVDDVQTTVSHTLSDYIEYLTARGDASISLTGNAQNNYIYGNGSSNKINGDAGKDTLTGNAGKDFFVFNDKLSLANVDKITDFRSVDDTIYLENAIFKKLKTGKLTPSAFWTGSKAHDASDRIIYQKSAGKLFFDMDGTGSSKAVLFATIKGGTGLSAADFIVI